ncbi:MAG: hypothetical protein N838_11905 [Thiohalocapsa sp. PB-PSB1]|nr:MAG: hypothetical protein N838_11905 [Thiohalocapsa sp. PB-PSB1]
MGLASSDVQMRLLVVLHQSSLSHLIIGSRLRN